MTHHAHALSPTVTPQLGDIGGIRTFYRTDCSSLYDVLDLKLILILPIYLRARRHRMNCADSTIPILTLHFYTCAEISHG